MKHRTHPVYGMARVGPVSFVAREGADTPEPKLRARVVVYDESAERDGRFGFTEAALQRLADAYIGLPVLDRRHEVEANPGPVVGVVRESQLIGSQIVQVHEYWEESVIRELREGVRQGYSISWRDTVGAELIDSITGQAVKSVSELTDGARILTTGAEPIEVTRTYAPVVRGATRVVELLRGSTLETETEQDGIAATDETDKADPIEALRTEVLSLTERLAELEAARAEAEAERDAARAELAEDRERAARLDVLRSLRTRRILSGTDQELLAATDGIGAQALRSLATVMRPSGPEPGRQLSDGHVPPDSPLDVSGLVSGQDFLHAAQARAQARGTDYLSEYRALRLEHSRQTKG